MTAIESVTEDVQAPASDAGERTVYCGNLAWSVSWQTLKDHLKEVGPVEFCEVLKYRDGRKTGSAIARFEKAEDAEKAIETLQDGDLAGRPLTIRADRENGKGPGSVRQGVLSDEKADKQIFVSNLTWKTTWRELKAFFEEKVGPVEYCDILANSDGRSSGSGVVRFTEQCDADKAKEELAEAEDLEIDGRKVFVREDRQRRAISGLSDRKGKGKGKKGGKKGGKGSSGSKEWSLFVGNLEKGTDWKALKEAFKEYWPTHVSVSEGRNSESCYAVVKFEKASHAEEAIDGINQAWIGDNQVTVRWDNQ